MTRHAVRRTAAARIAPLLVAVAGTLALAAGGARPAHAQAVSFVLTPATYFGDPGTIITLTGTITNLTTTDAVFLNGLTVSGPIAASPNFTIDLDSFFGYVPASLAANGTYTGNIVDIAISSGAPIGASAAGTATLNGGGPPPDAFPLAAAPFEVFVGTAALPEPSSGVLAVAGLALLGGATRWARRRRKTESP